MKCRKCGSILSENDIYCRKCGTPVGNNSYGTAYCTSCGTQNSAENEFCKECGCRLRPSDTCITGKKNNTKIIIAAVSGAAAIIAGAVCAVVIVSGTNNNSQPPISTTQAVIASAEVQITPAAAAATPVSALTQDVVPQNVPTAQPAAVETHSRPDLYNSSLTYKRMNSIHNSYLTDDTTYYIIKSVIEDFDHACESYMNMNDTSVLSYLRSGTTAYSQQTQYKAKHPNLIQSYSDINVINSRQDGQFFYAWVSETMNVTENGKSTVSTEHWVYKLAKDSGGWYINDYTRDPAF